MWLLVVFMGIMLFMLTTTNYKSNTMAIGTSESPDLTGDSVDDLLALSNQTGEFLGAWGTSSSDAQYIKLTTDLVLTADVLPKLQSDQTKSTWNPIGTDNTTRFYGTFDGGGHTITFIAPITIESQYGGLFGCTGAGSIIQNLGVNWQGGLTGTYYVGGIVASGLVSVIRNCFTMGEIQGTSSDGRVGGIGGEISGKVSNCYNMSNLFGGIYCGGILGRADDGNISYCYNLGSCVASGSNGWAAGIVGFAVDLDITIRNCFSIVESGDAINGEWRSSGISNNDGQNSYYNYPADNGTGNDVDLASKVSGEANINNFMSGGSLTWSSAWSIDSKENFERDSSGEAQSSADWTIVDGINFGFPILSVFYEYYDASSKPATLTGTGTQEDPYQISTAQDLKYIANTTSLWGTRSTPVNFELVDDIDYKDSWSPIGTDYSSPFCGVILGNNHEIKFTNLITLDLENVGFIGVSLTPLIKDLGINWQLGLIGIDNGTYPYMHVGGIIGTLNGSSRNQLMISNCYTKGLVIGYRESDTTDDYSKDISVGGLIGGGMANALFYIDNCYNYATVGGISKRSKSFRIGGLLGETGTVPVWIRHCYNYGTVYAYIASSVRMGGIIGWYGTNNEIGMSNCYNLGNIVCVTASTGYVGGIAGYGDNVSECINAGTVEAYARYVSVGGITGATANGNQTIRNCYNIGDIYGESLDDENTSGRVVAGGILGERGYLINCYNMGSITAISSSSPTYAGGIAGDYGYITNCFSIVDENSIQATSGNTSNTYENALLGRDDTFMGDVTTSYYGDYDLENSSNYRQNLTDLVKNVNNFLPSNTNLPWTASTETENYDWNFNDVWGISSMYNNGYPTLRTNYQATILYALDKFDYSQVEFQTVSLWEKDSDTVQVLGSDTFVREGYEFLYWQDSDGNIYYAGDVITVNGNSITLTAVWKELEFLTIGLQGVDIAENSPLFVYIFLDDKMLGQCILTTLTDYATINFYYEQATSLTLLFTCKYMTQIEFDIWQGSATQVGNKLIFNDLSEQTIFVGVFVTSVGENFNNSIVI